jgi:hypothetical protein
MTVNEGSLPPALHPERAFLLFTIISKEDVRVAETARPAS